MIRAVPVSIRSLAKESDAWSRGHKSLLRTIVSDGMWPASISAECDYNSNGLCECADLQNLTHNTFVHISNEII